MTLATGGTPSMSQFVHYTPPWIVLGPLGLRIYSYPYVYDSLTKEKLIKTKGQ